MKRYNINWTVKTLVNQMEKGNLNFDNAVQRSLVWDLEKKSLLIHSCLYGYSIPALYFTKNEFGGYDSLDGKQRSNALSAYLHDEFSLALTERDVVLDDDDNETNFNGLHFSELPEWAQDRIKDYNLTIYYYEDMTEAEIHEFFRRLNNGKPLTAVELTRVKALSIAQIQEIAKAPIIQEVTTDKGKARFNDEQIAMQIIGMAYMESPDFGTKAFRPWVCDYNVTDNQLADIMKALEKVSYTYHNFLEGADASNSKESKRVIRKIKSRTHFVSCVYLAMLVPDMSEMDFATMVWDFFNSSTTSVSNEYNATVGAGSARPEAIRTRKEVLEQLAASKKEG